MNRQKQGRKWLNLLQCKYNSLQMQQFKSEEKRADLSSLDPFTDELSLLTSRRGANREYSQKSEFEDRQSQEEIKQFKREIDQRFKLSIANKIYTFPRTIRSVFDIISSEQEGSPQHYRSNHNDKSSNEIKKKSSSKNQSQKRVKDKAIRLYEKEEKGIQSAKKASDKVMTHESTGKRREEYPKQRSKLFKIEKTQGSKNSKKKKERLKTQQQQSSSSFLQTLRSKCGKKN